MSTPAIEIRDFNFRFPGKDAMTLKDFNMVLPVGSRCLLVGDNGAVKQT
jgi:ABC-type transport system involved in cytochrome bd biosynthesis fused ATPase/permease subunit